MPKLTKRVFDDKVLRYIYKH